jgi:hypothetical protein
MIGLIDAKVLKLCTKCNITKSTLEFSNQRFRNDGLYPFCKSCLKNENLRYKRSVKGLINSAYSGMKRRVSSKNYEHRFWFGKSLLTKEEFIELVNKNKIKCLKLYIIWRNNNFNNNFTPSVDRKDSSIGYTKENITFLPTQENRYKATLWRYKK